MSFKQILTPEKLTEIVKTIEKASLSVVVTGSNPGSRPIFQELTAVTYDKL
jgi:hypothetical protein